MSERKESLEFALSIFQNRIIYVTGGALKNVGYTNSVLSFDLRTKQFTDAIDLN